MSRQRSCIRWHHSTVVVDLAEIAMPMPLSGGRYNDHSMS
jgi:hypothetical protein